MFYIIGFKYTFSAEIKDIIEIIILTIIFIYYISIILCYAFLSFYFFYDICSFKPFWEKLEIKIFLKLNSYFNKRNYPLPDINLISQTINPYLYKNYILTNNTNNEEDTSNEKDNLNNKIITKDNYDLIKKNFSCKDLPNKICLVLKLIMIALSPFGFWYIIKTVNKIDSSLIIFYIIYLIILILAFCINYPLNIFSR